MTLESNSYSPTDGGYQINIKTGARLATEIDHIGRCIDDPRNHRRPLYPSTDRTALAEKLSLGELERLPHRPLVIAFGAPRFILDGYRAGGLLGHLLIGYVPADGPGLWLHNSSGIDLSYVRGRLHYVVSDPALGGGKIELTALPLRDETGLVLHWQVCDLPADASLVFCYGGASASLTIHIDIQEPLLSGLTPDQCRYDEIICRADRFLLRRRFDQTGGCSTLPSDEQMSFPSDWVAEIHGTSDPVSRTGFGSAEAVSGSPRDLLDATQWHVCPTDAARPACVAVQEIRLHTVDNGSGHFVVGLGKSMEKACLDPAAFFAQAALNADSIAARLRVNTPDKHLNSAATMIPFVLEGCWGDMAYLHGSWSWRIAFLGWRVCYGPDVCGWTDRVRLALENHIRLSRVTEGDNRGGFRTSIEDRNDDFWYNMNEVFIDQIRHYYDYTGDDELLRRIFPILQGLVEWEDRRLQRGQNSLYENSLNTWVTDCHWQAGAESAQASAYMLRAHEFLAELAARYGQDAEPYARKARQIRAGMQKVLWMPEAGVFADFHDTVGAGLLHPSPELASVYHPAEFGAADPLQVYQMLHWVDTHLVAETTADGGRQFWSSNWHPNLLRSYTHSTHDLVYAENLNLAQVLCQAGRADDAYALLRGTFSGIFNGSVPGGLSCQTLRNGLGNRNWEFVDANSMWCRMVVEGLFGIIPKRHNALVNLTPVFPSTWEHASIETRLFSYSWKRIEGREIINWTAPDDTAVRLRLPVKALSVSRVTVDDESVAFHIERGVGLSWICLDVPSARAGSVSLNYVPCRRALPARITIKTGARVSLDVSAWKPEAIVDPQGILTDGSLSAGLLTGTVRTTAGSGLLFLQASLPCPVWIPVEFMIEADKSPRVWTPPRLPRHDLSDWQMLDIRSYFNTPIMEVPDRLLAAMEPPPLPDCQVNYNYFRHHLNQLNGFRGKNISDAAWRAKVGSDGVAWTHDGIPFLSSAVGNNIALVTRVGGFPTSLRVPVERLTGQRLFVMISGVTWPMQSHVVNLRLTLHYADGSLQVHELVNPFDIGDCWGTNLRGGHDTAANGFENLGCRFGPAGSADVVDMTVPIELDTEAHLLGFDLPPEQPLTGLTLEAVANDVFFGLMGATVLRASAR